MKRYDLFGFIVRFLIDDLAKEVGAISSRLRKIEEQLKEPVQISDPILNPGHSREYSRDTCIYGALVKSALEIIKKEQTKQNNASEELMTTIKVITERIEANFKLVMAMLRQLFISL